jgi:hypothetical protein
LVHAATGTGKTYAAWLGPVLEWLRDYPVASRRKAAPAPLRVLWVTPLRALAGDTESALRAPVVALVRESDTLVAVFADQVAWRDPVAAHWTVERPRVALGTLTAAGSDMGGVWLGGTLGLAWWNVGRGVYQRLAIPGDLPAPVRDVQASPRWVWVATDSGVVRLRRDAVVGGRE